MRNAIKWSAMVGAVVVSSVFAVSCMEPDEGSEGEDVGEVTEGDDEDLEGMEIEDVGEVGEPEEGAPDRVLVQEGMACPAGYLCLWTGAEKRGGRLALKILKRGCVFFSGGILDDEFSSWKNRTRHDYRLFQNGECAGRGVRARSGDQSMRMGGWNDKVSSICRVGLCP